MFKKDLQAALAQRIGVFNPEVIGISVRNIDDQNLESPRFLLENVRPLVEWCRVASSAPIILGGAGYSIFPDEVLEYLGADMGVHGEGETTFPAILERIARGEDPATLPGCAYRGRKGRLEQNPVLLSMRCHCQTTMRGPTLIRRVRDTWMPIESRRGALISAPTARRSASKGARSELVRPVWSLGT